MSKITPKEKAKELVHRFRNYLNVSHDKNDNAFYEVLNTKECALLVVDEIIEQQSDCASKTLENYWEQVREEIENGFEEVKKIRNGKPLKTSLKDALSELNQIG